jgi:hypothetical protein
VCEGDHQVEVALPDGHGDRDFREVEAPRFNEGEIVVDPTVEACGECPAHRLRHTLGESACQDVLVDLRNETAEGIRKFGTGNVTHRFGVVRQPRANVAFAA